MMHFITLTEVARYW